MGLINRERSGNYTGEVRLPLVEETCQCQWKVWEPCYSKSGLVSHKSASPRILLEKQTLWPHPRPTESASLS